MQCITGMRLLIRRPSGDSDEGKAMKAISNDTRARIHM